MYSDQRKRAVIFVSVVAQKLYPDISGPDLRIFDEESLNLSRVSRLICSNVFPLLHLDWVSITDTDTESANHAGEEFVVGKDEGVNPYIFL
jgi:hypothetical protein